MERISTKEEIGCNTLKKPPVVHSSLAILFGIAIGLLIAEVSLRVLDLGYRNRPVESDPVLHHVHPKSYHFRSHFGGHEVY